MGAEGKSHRAWFGNGLFSARVWLARTVFQEHSLKSSPSQWAYVQMQGQAAEHKQD